MAVDADVVDEKPTNDENNKKTPDEIAVRQINQAIGTIAREVAESAPEDLQKDAFAAIDAIQATAKEGYLAVGNTKTHLSRKAQKYLLTVEFVEKMLSALGIEKSDKEEKSTEITSNNIDSKEIKRSLNNILDEFEQGDRSAESLANAVENERNLMSTNMNLSDAGKEYVDSDSFKDFVLATIVKKGLLPPSKSDDKKSSSEINHKISTKNPSDTIRKKTETAKEIPGEKDKILKLFKSQNFSKLKKLSGKTWIEDGVKYSVQTGNSTDMATAMDLAAFSARQAGTPFTKQEAMTKTGKNKKHTTYVLVSSSQEK